MESSNYSLGDIAALLGNRSGFGNEDGLGWLILIFLFFGAMGGGWNRNPGPAVPPNVTTVTDVQSMINNQTVNTGLNNIALATADNNYQTAQLINGQTNILQQQNYANQINAVQGFDGVSQQLQNQMDQCCCSIKTQMLQDRLEDRNRELGVAQNVINNTQQTQNILGALGRFVAWTPSGSHAASSTVTTG